MTKKGAFMEYGALQGVIYTIFFVTGNPLKVTRQFSVPFLFRTSDRQTSWLVYLKVTRQLKNSSVANCQNFFLQNYDRIDLVAMLRLNAFHHPELTGVKSFRKLGNFQM